MKRAIHYVLAVLKQSQVPPGSKGFQMENYPDPILLKICARDIEESTVCDRIISFLCYEILQES